MMSHNHVHLFDVVGIINFANEAYSGWPRWSNKQRGGMFGDLDGIESARFGPAWKNI